MICYYQASKASSEILPHLATLHFAASRRVVTQRTWCAMKAMVLTLADMTGCRVCECKMLFNTALHSTLSLRLRSVPSYFTTRQPRRARKGQCRLRKPSRDSSRSQCNLRLVWQEDHTARERPKPARTTEAPGHVRHVTALSFSADEFGSATDRHRNFLIRWDAAMHRPKRRAKGAAS